MSNEQEKATFNGGVPNSVSSSLQPDKFDGTSFKSWQKKMHFYLHNLNMTRYLVEIEPTLPPGNTDPTVLASVQQWNHGDYLCKRQILHYLVDKLYDVYSEVSTSKILWENLETQFKVFNVGSGKFATANFLNYKMVDSRLIMDQVNELQLIFHGIADEGMKICETFTVNSIVEKLPPSWARLQNEATKRDKYGFIATHDANMAEYKRKGKAKVVHNSKGTAPPNKGGNNKIEPQPSTSFKKQGEQGKFKKYAGKYTFCHKKGHKAVEYRSKAKAAKSQTNQANLTEDDLCALVTEANVVMTNESPLEWWYDTGATTHICINRDMFSTYQKCKSGEKLMMGNVSHSKIEGTGKVVLKLTSRMSVTLNNVKHVPDMRKNLISGTLMNKHGFAINLESDQLILRKNGVFIGKGFVKGGLIKMCVQTVLKKNDVASASVVSNNSINKNSVAYLVESFDLWHERKDEVLEKFKEYKTEVENQLSKTIKIVRSDRGGEYDGPFNAFCQKHGIIHQTTAPYSPESNGVAERKNRTLKEMMNAMLQESRLAQNLWGEAWLTTNHILNKIPHKVTGNTPHELWKGTAPSYKYLKVWGCLAKDAVPPPKKVTVGSKTVDCIFIGYARHNIRGIFEIRIRKRKWFRGSRHELNRRVFRVLSSRLQPPEISGTRAHVFGS
ncbi:Ribonuclease H-like superfamily [Arabidopsis thaliana x Arabidopsis arenosa]|uniref:Ribonuclease H-like superfamily n=1 Tax=Arabidopsis thaliana x Arabidopsis arenosa TaxID=1240361 RepID=A0A8T2A7G6_9BRAS|nr:Ribonuclease H-like superfamily [Arabidopsis thaliana x Arabidopsis arenosa]